MRSRNVRKKLEHHMYLTLNTNNNALAKQFLVSICSDFIGYKHFVPAFLIHFFYHKPTSMNLYMHIIELWIVHYFQQLQLNSHATLYREIFIFYFEPILLLNTLIFSDYECHINFLAHSLFIVTKVLYP